jgi:hypothetical protein
MKVTESVMRKYADLPKSPDRSIRTPAMAALKRIEERSAEHVKRVGL